MFWSSFSLKVALARNIFSVAKISPHNEGLRIRSRLIGHLSFRLRKCWHWLEQRSSHRALPKVLGWQARGSSPTNELLRWAGSQTWTHCRWKHRNVSFHDIRAVVEINFVVQCPPVPLPSRCVDVLAVYRRKCSVRRFTVEQPIHPHSRSLRRGEFWIFNWPNSLLKLIFVSRALPQVRSSWGLTSSPTPTKSTRDVSLSDQPTSECTQDGIPQSSAMTLPWFASQHQPHWFPEPWCQLFCPQPISSTQTLLENSESSVAGESSATLRAEAQTSWDSYTTTSWPTPPAQSASQESSNHQTFASLEPTDVEPAQETPAVHWPSNVVDQACKSELSPSGWLSDANAHGHQSLLASHHSVHGLLTTWTAGKPCKTFRANKKDFAILSKLKIVLLSFVSS